MSRAAGPPLSSAGFARLQGIGAAAVLAVAVGLLWAAVRWSGDFVILSHDANARWITLPQPALGTVVRVDRAQPPRWSFATGFRLARAPESARLHLRGVREVALSVNGAPVSLAWDPERWKRGVELEVGPLLRVGGNRIEARVANPEGPPLLQLRIDGLETRVATGPGWSATRVDGEGGERVAAVVASDLRRHPHAEVVPSPLEALGARAPWLAAVFVAFAVVGGLRPRWPDLLGGKLPGGKILAGENAVRTAGVAVALFWGAVFATKSLDFPPHLGFDSEGHYEYLALLAREWRLPDARDGWSTFHPPLYHGLTALLRRGFATAPGSLGDRVVLHALPLLAGVVAALCAGGVARRVLPGRPAAAAVAVLAVGLLPMHVLMGSFVSNEPVNAGLVAVALWLACRALTDERASPALLAALAVALGGALLAKTTSLPLAPLVVALVGAKLWLVEGRGLPRSLLVAAGMLAGTGLLAGWFYARNWLLFGNPAVTNYDVPAGSTYWLAPGFHTPDWYLRFGEALVRPWFASFASFWDGLYATFWADGAVSGRVGLKYPNPHWDYAAMAALYPLALPATGLLLGGLGVCAWRSARGEDLGRRLALTLLLLMVFGSLLSTGLITLRYPHHVYPKAFYALPAAVPLAVAFAAASDALHRRLSAPGGALLVGYAGTLGVAIVMAFLG